VTCDSSMVFFVRQCLANNCHLLGLANSDISRMFLFKSILSYEPIFCLIIDNDRIFTKFVQLVLSFDYYECTGWMLLGGFMVFNATFNNISVVS
jgi:hypothetical protein